MEAGGAGQCAVRPVGGGEPGDPLVVAGVSVGYGNAAARRAHRCGDREVAGRCEAGDGGRAVGVGHLAVEVVDRGRLLALGCDRGDRLCHVVPDGLGREPGRCGLCGDPALVVVLDRLGGTCEPGDGHRRRSCSSCVVIGALGPGRPGARCWLGDGRHLACCVGDLRLAVRRRSADRAVRLLAPQDRGERQRVDDRVDSACGCVAEERNGGARVDQLGELSTRVVLQRRCRAVPEMDLTEHAGRRLHRARTCRCRAVHERNAACRHRIGDLGERQVAAAVGIAQGSGVAVCGDGRHRCDCPACGERVELVCGSRQLKLPGSVDREQEACLAWRRGVVVLAGARERRRVAVGLLEDDLVPEVVQLGPAVREVGGRQRPSCRQRLGTRGQPVRGHQGGGLALGTDVFHPELIDAPRRCAPGFDGDGVRPGAQCDGGAVGRCEGGVASGPVVLYQCVRGSLVDAHAPALGHHPELPVARSRHRDLAGPLGEVGPVIEPLDGWVDRCPVIVDRGIELLTDEGVCGREVVLAVDCLEVLGLQAVLVRFEGVVAEGEPDRTRERAHLMGGRGEREIPGHQVHRHSGGRDARRRGAGRRRGSGSRCCAHGVGG